MKDICCNDRVHCPLEGELVPGKHSLKSSSLSILIIAALHLMALLLLRFPGILYENVKVGPSSAGSRSRIN